MEEQKKVLMVSVLVTVFLTTFVVSMVLFLFFYRMKEMNLIKSYVKFNQEEVASKEKIIPEKEFVEVSKKSTCGECSENIVALNFCNDGVIIPSIEDKCGCSTQPTCVESGSKNLISKGSVDWQKLINVGNLGFFKEGIDGDLSDYYLVGKVNSGQYKGFELYTITGSYGPGNLSFKMLKKDGVAFIFNGYRQIVEKESNNWEMNFLKDSIKNEKAQIKGDILIEELIFPEGLVFDSGKAILSGGEHIEYSFFTNQSYNILKKAFMSDYGQVWMTDRARASDLYTSKKNKTDQDYENYSVFDTNAFYIKAPDGSVVLYKLDIQSIAEYSYDYMDRFVKLKFSWNDGEKHDSDYEVYPSGCGTASYAYDFSNRINIKNDLQVVGKMDNGDVIYGFKNATHSEFKTLYKDIYNEMNGEKKSEEEFLKTHPQVFWVDPFGRLLSFYSTDIISPAECGKPVIYLYPEEDTDVHVQVFPGNGFTITDPDYGENGWFVKASPAGVLTNYADNKNYPYLFWEGYGDELYLRSQKGFVVNQNNLDSFFNDKLSQLGLNDQEIFDFKEFWVPRMKEENKNYYFITFLSQGFINKLAPLKVDPKPDSVIRVLMDYEGLDEYKEVKEQKIITPERKGFTVVEWGGMLH